MLIAQQTGQLVDTGQNQLEKLIDGVFLKNLDCQS